MKQSGGKHCFVKDKLKIHLQNGCIPVLLSQNFPPFISPKLNFSEIKTISQINMNAI